MLQFSAFTELLVNQLLPFCLIARLALFGLNFILLFDGAIFSSYAKPKCLQASWQSRNLSPCFLSAKKTVNGTVQDFRV